MSKYDTPVRANNQQLISAVSKILAVKVTANTWDEFATEVDSVADVGLPFTLSSLHPVYERLVLYGETLHPKKKSMLLNFIEEAPGERFIMMDKMLQGPAAAHIVMLLPDCGALQQQITLLRNNPKVVLNTLPKG